MNLSRSFIEFLFPTRSSSSLAILRSGLGLAVVFFCLSFSSPWDQAFASHGNTLIDRELAEAIAAYGNPATPRLGWLVAFGHWFGVSEKYTLGASYVALLLSGGCLVFDYRSRIAAFTAWFVHLAAVTSAGLASYGVDQFMTIGLFYLLVAPLPKTGIFNRKVFDQANEDKWVFGFFQRVLQLHLCFIYFFGGLAKCFGPGWWNGDSMWRALTRPPFDNISPQALVVWSPVFPIMGIVVCMIEICYPIFIWPKTTRDAWLLLVAGMHCAIALTMGMYLFGFVMIVLNLAAFGPRSRGRTLLRLLPLQIRKRFKVNRLSKGRPKARLDNSQMPENVVKVALYCA